MMRLLLSSLLSFEKSLVMLEDRFAHCQLVRALDGLLDKIPVDWRVVDKHFACGGQGNVACSSSGSNTAASVAITYLEAPILRRRKARSRFHDAIADRVAD
jgi:hypothetical protein